MFQPLKGRVWQNWAVINTQTLAVEKISVFGRPVSLSLSKDDKVKQIRFRRAQPDIYPQTDIGLNMAFFKTRTMSEQYLVFGVSGKGRIFGKAIHTLHFVYDALNISVFAQGVVGLL